MFSKLEQLTKACAELDRRDIVMHENRCLRKRHVYSSCRRCSVVCPSGAITCSEGIDFQAEKCTGCGACTSVCPSGALAAKLPSSKEMNALVALHVEHSGAVAFACEAYLKAHPNDRQRVITVQCVARCDESILVDAVVRGATSVSIINACCEDCRQNKICGLVETMVDTANRLLECWKYSAVIALSQEIPEKIKRLPITEDEVTGMSRRAFLAAFKRKSASLFTRVLPEIILGADDKQPETLNPFKEAKYLPDKCCSLVNSLKQFKATAASMSFQSSLWGDIRV
ncbi:MAG: 4Fe-4S binding protein, partial [Sporomusa sp.]